MEKTQTSEIGQEVDWVRRRDFSWAAAGTILGLGVNGLDVDRLAALLPTDPTDLFRSLDFSRGSGLCRSAVVAQLRSALPLLDTASTTPVRQRLLVATADLGLVAAWASYDAEHHHDARRLFLLALSVIQQTERPQAGNLAVYLLMDMAHQSLHLRQPQQTLDLIQLGYGTATRHTQPLSASTASYLASHQAWGQAAQGCDRALGQAVEHFTHADSTPATPWATHITAAEIAAQQGHTYYTLALVTADSKHAARAVPLRQQAVDGYGPAYARSRAVNLPGLAGAHALAGDLDTAARTGHRAVGEITALASPRAYERLRTLDAVLQHHNGDPAIGAVRAHIQTALVAA